MNGICATWNDYKQMVRTLIRLLCFFLVRLLCVYHYDTHIQCVSAVLLVVFFIHFRSFRWFNISSVQLTMYFCSRDVLLFKNQPSITVWIFDFSSNWLVLNRARSEVCNNLYDSFVLHRQAPSTTTHKNDKNKTREKERMEKSVAKQTNTRTHTHTYMLHWIADNIQMKCQSSRVFANYIYAHALLLVPIRPIPWQHIRFTNHTNYTER